MPHPKGWALPPPEYHQEFETLCLDLLKARKRPVAEPGLYGRNGQQQHGVDFVLQLRDGLHGYQCKRVDALGFREIENEVKKMAGFPNPLQSFTILITVGSDTRLQDEVSALSWSRVEAGQCPVAVVFWPTIRDWLAEYPAIARVHVPEIFPALEDLVQGRARRLDQVFPGATLELRSRPGQTQVIIHPGPGGVPLKTTLIGQEAKDRFDAAMKAGEAVTFVDDEFRWEIHEALEVGDAPRPGKTNTLTMSPSMNGRTVAVGLVVEPVSKHSSIAVFKHRASRSADAIPAHLTVENYGTRRLKFVITPDRIPFRFAAEQVADDTGGHGQVVVDRCYVGATVESALKAERLIAVMDGGAYVGVFGLDLSMTWEHPSTAPPSEEGGLLGTLEVLVELSDATGWDIVVRAEVSSEELAVAASLLELFQTGRRVRPGGGSIEFMIQGEEQLAILKSIVASPVEPKIASIQQDPCEIEFLGVNRAFPATDVRAPVMISAEVRERVLSAEAPPVRVTVQIPSGAEVVETLSPRDGNQ